MRCAVLVAGRPGRQRGDVALLAAVSSSGSIQPGSPAYVATGERNRRVQQWRGIMANKLVYAASEATLSSLAECRKWSYLGATPRVDFSVIFLGEATGFGKNS